MNYKQLYAIKAQNERRILRENPNVPNQSGIYFLLREENGFKYAYIGQAKKLLSRLADHLSGYQHIDLSIKKHGFWSEENPTGYTIHFLKFPESLLDEKEQLYIKKYAAAGYQLRNSTAGSQGRGKHGLDNTKPSKGYYDGLKQGYKNAKKEIGHLFALHLECRTKKDPPGKLQLKALEKFNNFISDEAK